MDKRTATLTLTEKLHSLGYKNLVADPAMKSYLLDNAKSVVLDLKDGKITTCDLTDCLWDVSSDFFSNFANNIPSALRDFTMANYFFVENKEWKRPHQLLATPVAIISEIEEKVLREKFYKDVTDETVEALDALKIRNFIKAYKVYSSISDFKHACSMYVPFEVGMAVEVGDVIQGAQSKKYYLVEKINKDSIEGPRFEDDALEHACEKGEWSNCNNEHTIPIKKKTINLDFISFVFNIPYEDQNIGANKAILKGCVKSTDICSILTKEYSKEKYFQEYFEFLDEESKKKVVGKIKLLKVQKNFLNSWLFRQGFDVQMDYLGLYKNDAKGFIAYFNKSDNHLKELIVSDLFESEYVNREVIEFLEKNYSPLLRDVSFKN